MAVALFAVGCTQQAPQRNVTVTVVHGRKTRRIVIDQSATVGRVLVSAGIRPRDGQWLAATSKRPLGPNHHAATVAADGQRVERSSTLHGRTRIEVIDGDDTVEATRTERRPIPPSGLPNAIQYVQHSGAAGVAEAVVGERSGEEVELKTVKEMVPAHRGTGKVLALTFDDGPDPRFTPKVLDILKVKKVPAAFCEVGNLVEKHPEITRRIVKLGHQLCNHTVHHVEGLEAEPMATIEAEIGGGRKALEKAGGIAPTYYRPPGGSLAPVIYDVAGKHEESVLYWSIDPRDWRRPTAQQLVVTVVSQMGPGGIILLHDGGGDRQSTVDALPAIIDFGRALGYTFVVPVSGRSVVG